ncbi:hypothetical protein BJ165DRAFT_1491885 [Panaeolus papilionaceus]|nr:hypothetical protein BJ165DRAFT_1491885 [Panaeolus papilionaceus]
MNTFGPGHEGHEGIAWPGELYDLHITIPTAFRQLLCHNDPPTNSMQQHISSVKERCMQEIDEIDTEVEELHEKIHALERQRARSEKVAFACDVVLAPFRRLPDDIIYRIFQEVFQSQENTVVKGQRVHVPSRLARISKSVSNVAHSPNLWQKIYCGWKVLRLSWATIDRINNLSRLSGNLPIHIIFDDERGYTCDHEAFRLQIGGYTTGDVESRIGEVLCWMLTSWEHRHRWNMFTVAVCYSHRWLSVIRDTLVQNVDADGAENVQLFQVKSRSCRHGRDLQGNFTDVAELSQVMDCFPAIRYVSHSNPLTGVERILTLESNAPGRRTWLALTSVDLSYAFTPAEWTLFLRLCPNLEKGRFSLHPAASSASVPARSQPIISPYAHQHMRSMCLRYYYYPNIPDQIFCAFVEVTFPALASLDLDIPTIDDPSTHDPMRLDFDVPLGARAYNFTEVFPSLQSMVLRVENLEVPMMFGTVQLLTAIPSITNLRVCLSYTNIPHFLEFVRGSAGKPCPLPQIRSLEMELSPEIRRPRDNFDLDFSEDLLKTRKSVVEFQRKGNATPTPLGESRDAFRMAISFTWSSTYAKRGDTYPPKTQVQSVVKYFLDLQQKYLERDLGIDVVVVDKKVPDSHWVRPDWSLIPTDLMSI